MSIRNQERGESKEQCHFGALNDQLAWKFQVEGVVHILSVPLLDDFLVSDILSPTAKGKSDDEEKVSQQTIQRKNEGLNHLRILNWPTNAILLDDLWIWKPVRILVNNRTIVSHGRTQTEINAIVF
jgi:hypothetical protein